MATEEARALLDSLMGNDRNAVLPKGAALPGKQLDLSGAWPAKKTRSCFDRDIDPLYTAWGIDVYDLFVNTKSDLGINPYIVDQAAHQQFQNLPKAEQEALGYHYFLFQKLNTLVQQNDRTVMRNKQKLAHELRVKQQQQQSARVHGSDDIDSAAVEQYLHTERIIDVKCVQLQQKQDELEHLDQQHQALSHQLTLKLNTTNTTTTDDDDGATTTTDNNDDMETQQLKTKLGQVTLQRQGVISELAQLVHVLYIQQQTLESQFHHLVVVPNDTTLDKTVCEISGNFMSRRDADERIAAHYAGKQYVGWKLVRDKHAALSKEYGRQGPPPPARRPVAPPRGGRWEHDRSRPHRGGRWERDHRPPPPRGGGGGGRRW